MGIMELPTLDELVRDRGFVGRILSKLPPSLLSEADKKPDPWLFLVEYASRRKWPQNYVRFFEAAASQTKATVRLGEIPRGGGSISASWWLKMCNALTRGDERSATRATRKVVGSICRSKRGRQWLMEDENFPPEFRERARQVYGELYAKDKRKLGRRKADDKWKGDPDFDLKRETASDKIAVELVRGWLRGNRNGASGYCFCSDEVLATILGAALKLRSLDRELIKKIRRRLGLKKATNFYVLKDGKVVLLK